MDADLMRGRAAHDETPAEMVYRLRCSLGLSQRGFAERFGLSFGGVKDLEQGRRQPSSSLRVLLRTIEVAPDAVERAAHSS